MVYDAIYDPDTDFDRWHTIGCGEAIAAHIADGDTVLELGCATGLMTGILARRVRRVHGIDRSAAYLDVARRRGLANAAFYHLGIDDLAGLDPFGYEHVVAANVICEVDDPGALLDIARRHGVTLHLTAQNPESLHRIVGARAGIVARDRAARFGSIRDFTADELVDLAAQHGWTHVETVGVGLKPLPNETMATLTEDVQRAFAFAGDLAAGHASMTYCRFE